MPRARTLIIALCPALALACDRADLPTAPSGAAPAAGAPRAGVVEAARIAFSTNRDNLVGDFDIYTMDADGSNLAQVTSGEANDNDPAVSPDGSRILFTRALDGNQDVYVVGADGSGEARLTSDAAADVRPAWSPDGLRIAFTSARDGDNEIFVMDLDGGNLVQLTSNATFDASPAWSPDGSRIAYACSPDGGDLEICVMKADGTEQTNLTNNSAVENDPTWSPDGRIGFTSNRGATYSSVYVMDADGTDVQQLTPSSLAGPDDQPTWSPDGAQIAFVRANDVWVMDADGSNPVNRTNNGSQTVVNEEPDWGVPTAVAAPTADLAVEGSAAGAAGKTVVYTFTVGNLGPDAASDVRLGSVLPTSARFVAASTTQGSCSGPRTGQSGAVECALGAVADGGSVTVRITVKPTPAKARPSVSASVTSATGDPEPSNDAVTISAP